VPIVARIAIFVVDILAVEGCLTVLLLHFAPCGVSGGSILDLFWCSLVRCVLSGVVTRHASYAPLLF